MVNKAGHGVLCVPCRGCFDHPRNAKALSAEYCLDEDDIPVLDDTEWEESCSEASLAVRSRHSKGGVRTKGSAGSGLFGCCVAEDFVEDEEDTDEDSTAYSRGTRDIGTESEDGGDLQARTDFSGHWKCVDTWGLDDFLKANGIGAAQRMLARNSRWPSWIFEQDGDHIIFVNKSQLGELREDFFVGGPSYMITDGWKQVVTCRAWWEDRVLVIERDLPQGRVREERRLDGDRLMFTLRSANDGPDGVSWGRAFKRQGL